VKMDVNSSMSFRVEDFGISGAELKDLGLVHRKIVHDPGFIFLIFIKYR
jgi:hypothetical protein